jgi:predicted DNA-binding protein YlxM (UPF0122 family)
MSKTFTIRELAKILNVSNQAVWSLIKRKRLQATYEDNRTYYIAPIQFANYIKLRVSELDKEKNTLENLLKTMQ